MPTVTCNGNLVELVHAAWAMPSLCPSCKSVIRRKGVHYFCQNPDCEAQIYERLQHAVSKGALDIDGCGEAVVRGLIKHGVRLLSDLFAISDVTFLGSAASKSFLKSREACKTQPMWRKMYALGIEGIGRTACKEIAAMWPSVDKIQWNSLGTVLGPVNAETFLKWFQSHDNLAELDRLEGFGLKFEDKVITGPLSGKVFCITGTMLSGTRDQVSKKIEEAGGLVKNSVSKSVGYLVSGPGAGNNKAAAAQKLGTKVIDEEELYRILGVEMPVVSSEDVEY